MKYGTVFLHAATYVSGALMMLVAAVSFFGVSMPGVSVDDPKTVFFAGLGIITAAVKGDQAKAAAAAILLALCGAWLVAAPAPAMAADMPLKAPVLARSQPCTITWCTGFFIGGNLANAGGNFDVLGTGLTGLAQNGLGMGAQAGYEFWNGQWYAALQADIDSDLALNAMPGTSFKNRLTYGVRARLGYSLASAFGAATNGTAVPTLPQQLLQSLMTPYINVGEVWRHSQPALVSGAGVEALIATSWTINADYYHYSYNQGGSAGTVGGLPIAQNSDNEFRLSLNYHPRFGF